MNLPVLKTYHSENLPLILVVDKIGVIGEGLANNLSTDFLVVLVSPNPPKSNKNTVHIPFIKKIAQVPDNKYSKIFIVDDGEAITHESSMSFIQIAKESSAQLFFIGSVRNIDTKYADQITTAYTNSKVLIFGDLFDKNIFFDKSASINRYILEARKNKEIDVEGNGLSLSFPITFEDTIKLIIKASYLIIPQKVILLFYPHPITDISLANMFKKINPEIKVDFVKEVGNKNIYIPSGAQHAISKYNLEEKIKDLDLEDKTNRELKLVQKENNKKSFFKPFLFFLLGCLFLALLPLITTGAYSILGLHQINSAKNEAEKGNLEKARRSARNAKTFFEIGEKTSNILDSEAALVGRKSDTDKLINKIESGKDLSSATIYLLDGAQTLKNIYGGKSFNPKSDFESASNSLKSAIVLIQKIKAEGNLPPDFEKKFNDIDPLIETFSNSSEILPEVLGFEGEKTYLVLFQNNMELRPGGGFIGSYAILKIKNAKISEFKINDVYQTDGQLKEHIEPPFAIRRYLPSVHWYLRDSNFDPDFVGSAISAANIYTIETKNKIDGVIGLDLSFAKNILSSIGEVNVPDYNKKINEDNFYKVTQEQSEKNFFPGSTQKKDFLSALANSIQLNLKNRKDIPYLSLGQKIGNSIEEKHLLFAFAKSDIQNIFTANGWSGSLWDNRKDEESLNDCLGISEANLGVNKVNYFVSRSVSKKVTLTSDGKISSHLTIAFRNSSKEDSKFGGNYKNYMRLILPKDTKITSIEIDNKKLEIKNAVTDYFIYESKGFKPPGGIELEEEEELGKSVFGFLVNVPRNSIKTIVLTYDLPFSVSKNESSFKYSLKVNKQPGVDSYPIDLTLALPPSYQIINNKSTNSVDLTRDQEFNYVISQK